MRLPCSTLAEVTVISAIVFLVTALMTPARSKAALDVWTGWDIVLCVSGGIVVLGLTAGVIALGVRWMRRLGQTIRTTTPSKEP